MFFSVARSSFFRQNMKSSEFVHTATCPHTATEWVQEHCVSVWITQSFVQHTQSYACGKMEYCNKLRKLLRSTTHNCLRKHLLTFQAFITCILQQQNVTLCASSAFLLLFCRCGFPHPDYPFTHNSSPGVLHLILKPS